MQKLQAQQVKKIAEAIAKQLLVAKGSATETSRGILVKTRGREVFFPKSSASGVGSISRGI